MKQETDEEKFTKEHIDAFAKALSKIVKADATSSRAAIQAAQATKLYDGLVKLVIAFDTSLRPALLEQTRTAQIRPR